MAEVVSTNQFRNGMHIELDGQTWRIVEFQHVKPGKGGAFVRTKLKASRRRARSSTRRSAPARSSRASAPSRRTCSTSTTRATRSSSWTSRTTSSSRCRTRCSRTSCRSCSPRRSVQVMFVGGDAVRRRAAVVGRARGDRHGARGQGRHGLERDEAGDARDGRRRPGAALRERRRQDQESTRARSATSSAPERPGPATDRAGSVPRR